MLQKLRLNTVETDRKSQPKKKKTNKEPPNGNFRTLSTITKILSVTRWIQQQNGTDR